MKLNFHDRFIDIAEEKLEGGILDLIATLYVVQKIEEWA